MKNGAVCLVFKFPSWVLAFNLSRKFHFLQFCADFSKKPKFVRAIYIFPLKVLKVGGSMVQGQVFLKEGGSWHFSYFIFLRLIIFTLRNYFTLCKTLCIWKKNFFFCNHNYMKKGHSKLSKNEPEDIP